MNLLNFNNLLMDLVIKDPVKTSDSWIYIAAGAVLIAAGVVLVLVLRKKKKTDNK